MDCRPRSVRSNSPLLALRWSMLMTRKSFLNSSMMLIAAMVDQLRMREFKPPPGVANSGKPVPIST